MNELNRKFKNRTLRIAIFSLGGILIVAGIILAGWGVQLLLTEGIVSDFIFVSVIILAVGICICILSVTVPRYMAKTRNMSREEKVIHNIKTYMKKRKSRIVTCSIFLAFMIAISMWMMSMGNKLTENMTDEHFRLLAVVKFMICHYLFGIFMGFIAFMLIDQFAGFTKNKHVLTVNMWERIHELESEVKKLKAGMQEDNQNK